jgi:hypothetical protein
MMMQVEVVADVQGEVESAAKIRPIIVIRA